MKRRSLTCTLLLLYCATTAAAQQTPPDRSVYRLVPPGKDWAFDLSLAGFELVAETPSDDGQGLYLQAAHRGKTSASLLFIAVTPAKAQGGAAEMREHALKRLKKAKLLGNSPKTSEHKQIAVAKYTQRSEFGIWAGAVGGSSNPTMNALARTFAPRQVVVAYLVKDDVWMQISLAGMDSLNSEEEALFYSLLDSVSVADMTRPAATSLDHFYKGRTFYYRNEYQKALEHFRPALELEARERRLNDVAWRRLVWETSNAYAQTGSLDKTKATFEYGLATEPTYTPFHYGMARTYANLDDLDNTIASLQKALANRKRDPHILSLPDPLKDAAFARFHKSEKFRKAMKDLK